MQTTNISPAEVRSMPDSHPLAPLIDSMQESAAAYLRLFDGLPGVVRVERDEVGWSIGPSTLGKEILWTRFAEARCDQQIDALLAEISEHCEGIDWPIYRTCTPRDLGARLEAKGLRRGGVQWMLAELGEIVGLPWPDAEFHIEIVTRAEELRVWWHASAAGFGSTAEGFQVFHDAYLRAPFGADENCVHYIGYLGEEPVMSGSLLLTEEIAGLFAISTPPARPGVRGGHHPRDAGDRPKTRLSTRLPEQFSHGQAGVSARRLQHADRLSGVRLEEGSVTRVRQRRSTRGRFSRAPPPIRDQCR